MEEVQDSGGGETQKEDGKHQRAGLDVHGPVEVRSLQLADDPGEANNGDHEGSKEAEEG